MQEQKADKQGPKRNGAVKSISAAEKAAQSDAFKSEGNSAFKAGNFADAVALYSAALELTPNSNVRSSH
jgi:Flp pilus assembly protein TadD